MRFGPNACGLVGVKVNQTSLDVRLEVYWDEVDSNQRCGES